MKRRTVLGALAGAAVVAPRSVQARRPAGSSASPDWERTYEGEYGYLTAIESTAAGYDVAGWRAENTRRRTVVGALDASGEATESRLVSIKVPGKPWDRVGAGGNPVVAGEAYDRDRGYEAWIGAVGDDGYRWETTASANKESGFRSVVAVEDGFLAAGWSGESISDGGGLVARVGPDGAVRWEEAYAGRIWAIEPFGDGFAVAGATGPDDESAWIAVLEADGAVRWERTVDRGAKAFDLAPLEDGSLAVCGKSSPSAWLSVIDGDGSMRWEREYGDSGGDRFEAIRPVEDGFALAGITMSYARADAPRSGWLVATDADGEITGDAAVGSGENHEVFDVAVREDGGVAFVGARNDGEWVGWAVGWNGLPTQRSASGVEDDEQTGDGEGGESDAENESGDGGDSGGDALPGLGAASGVAGLVGGAAAAARARGDQRDDGGE